MSTRRSQRKHKRSDHGGTATRSAFGRGHPQTRSAASNSQRATPRTWRATYTAAAVLATLTLGLSARDALAAAPASVYRGSADALALPAAVAGYETLTPATPPTRLSEGQATGGRSTWAATYSSANGNSAMLAIFAWQTEAAATTAVCPKPCTRSRKDGWLYTRSAPNRLGVLIEAQCRNLVVVLRRSSTTAQPSPRTHIDAGVAMVGKVFASAAARGMASCRTWKDPFSFPATGAIFGRGTGMGNTTAIGTVSRPSRVSVRIRPATSQQVDVELLVACTKQGRTESRTNGGYVDAPTSFELRLPIVAPDSCSITVKAQLRYSGRIVVELVRLA